MLLYSSTFCFLKDTLEINLCKQVLSWPCGSRVRIKGRRIIILYILYHFIICVILLIRVIYVLSFSSSVQNTCWIIYFRLPSHSLPSSNNWHFPETVRSHCFCIVCHWPNILILRRKGERFCSICYILSLISTKNWL